VINVAQSLSPKRQQKPKTRHRNSEANARQQS
jgi:hypothetical protein